MPFFPHRPGADSLDRASTAVVDLLAALLRGDAVPWDIAGIDAAGFLDAADEHGVTNLIHRCGLLKDGWPCAVRSDLAQSARSNLAAELSRRHEIRGALEALGAAGVRPILFKGTALAYTVYDAPDLRPRLDTDILVPQAACAVARRVLTGLGYLPDVICDGELVLCQFSLTKPGGPGVPHTFDVHWKISTQSAFAEILSYDDLVAHAVPVPELGPHALAAGPVAALLLACVHPVMHHRNTQRLLWLYDMHLLVRRLSAPDLNRFVEHAIARGVSAICAYQLELAMKRLGTPVPTPLIARLAGAHGEPTAAYLRPRRRWRHEFLSNVRGLPGWSQRLRLLREVAVPSPGYVLSAYGLKQRAPGLALLPALYVHRLARGLARVVLGRK